MIPFNQSELPSFTIWKNGKKKDGLVRSFLRVLTITTKDFDEGFVTLEDRSMWALYCEENFSQILKHEQSAKAVISFQDFGDKQLAIARVFHPHYQDERRAQLVARRNKMKAQNPGGSI